MKIIRVGITSIGSGVGQSVVTACRLSGMPLHLVGYGNNPLAFGAFDCHERKMLPSIYSAGYADQLLEACRSDGVDVLIPGLDDELLLLAGMAGSFQRIGTQVVACGIRMLQLCRDKELMWRELSKISGAFVRGYTRASLLDSAGKQLIRYPLIAKPVSGSASRGVFIIRGESDLARLTDAHVVQEIVAPAGSDPNRDRFLRELNDGEVLQVSEISAQILLGRNGRELGRFLSCNTLTNGVPVEIVPLAFPEIWSEIDKLLPYFREAGLWGPLNVQGRLTDDGPRFFEMNARFTGITGLRALAGFNEVAALIADLSGYPAGESVLHTNPRKIGLRQVVDRVVDFEADQNLARAVESQAGFSGRGRGRRILVTGANGYLGRAVLETLLSELAIDSVVAMVRNPSRFDGRSEPALPEGVEVVDAATLFSGGLQLGAIDVICHLASGRPHHNAADLAAALRFTHVLTIHAIRHQIPGFIHASSQAVYGTSRPPLWTEELPPVPETVFAQSQWSAELMTAAVSQLSPASKTASLRFPQLIGPSPVRDTVRLAHKYVDLALSGQPLRVQGGRQRLDFLDVRDAAELVRLLIVASFADWPEVLNAGGEPVSVLDLVNSVADAAVESGLSRPLVQVDPDFSAPDFGMSREKAHEHFKWAPRHSLRRTLLDLFKEAASKSSRAI